MSLAAVSEDTTAAPRAYTVNQSCARANVSRSSLYEAISAGDLVARKRGRRTMILEDDLDRWMRGWPLIKASHAGGVDTQKSDAI